MKTVSLLGLDLGSTTSSAVAASAVLAGNVVTGRMQLSSIQEAFRSEMAFTPMKGDRLDLDALGRMIDGWLSASGIVPDRLFAGGALLTGLTAQKENAPDLIALIRERLGDALVATADDPCLESWLAFLGGCSALSHAFPTTHVLNLDIGGGTTNLALGLNGEVLRTGCLFVGARHVEVEPGTYRIVRVSRYARAMLDHLGVTKDAGVELSPAEVDAILDFYLALLGDAAGAGSMARTRVAELHTQVPFRPVESAGCIVTVSGGVGELIYSHLDGRDWPSTTKFGDLGIDLARRLVESPWWRERLRQHRPASVGRATVYGLLRHSTEISGSTLYLPEPGVLPLDDLPIVGTVDAHCSDERLAELLTLAGRGSRGGCLRIDLVDNRTTTIRHMGQRLASALNRVRFDPQRPLILLTRENAGKTLGHYATEWGALAVRLIAIDEVPARDAHFARLGRMREGVVPVAFYGLR